MKIKITFLLVILAFLLISPIQTSAFDLKTGTELNIASSTDSIFEGNLYIAGGNTNFEANVPGDLVLVSGESNIKGVVEKDVIISSGQVIFDGHVKGDLRVVGGEVTINGVVEGDTIVVGGDVILGEKAELKGDIFVVGGQIVVNSPIFKYAKLISGLIEINGSVAGHLDVTTQKLNFGDKANISGSINYFAPEKAGQSNIAKVDGNVNFNQISSIQDSNIFKKVVLSFLNFWILLRFVTTLLLSFLLVYIFRIFSQKVSEYALNSFLKSLVIGLSVVILVPILSILFFVSLIALPISILLMLVFIFMITISTAVAGIILGMIIHKVFKKEENPVVSFQSATIGVILLTVLQFVPMIGDFTRTVFFLVAIGAMSRHIYTYIRFNKA